MSETVEDHGRNQKRNRNMDRTQMLEDAFIRMTNCIERLEERMDRRGPGNHEGADGVIFERFQKCRPPKFSGENGSEEAEKWITALENIFCAMNYAEKKKVTLAGYQLEGRAMDWWDFLRQKWELMGRNRLGITFSWNSGVSSYPEWSRSRRKASSRILSKGH